MRRQLGKGLAFGNSRTLYACPARPRAADSYLPVGEAAKPYPPIRNVSSTEK